MRSLSDLVNEALKGTRNRVIFTSAAVFLGVLWVSNAFFLAPIKGKIERLKKEKAVESEKSEIVESLASIEEKLAQRQRYLLGHPDTALVIEIINKIGEESGMELSSITPQRVEKKGPYARIPIQVESRCTWHELGEFSSRLEESSPFMKFDRINLQGLEEKEQSGKSIMVKLVISAFAKVG